MDNNVNVSNCYALCSKCNTQFKVSSLYNEDYPKCAECRKTKNAIPLACKNTIYPIKRIKFDIKTAKRDIPCGICFSWENVFKCGDEAFEEWTFICNRCYYRK